MKQGIFKIIANERIAENTFRLIVEGDASAHTRPGQFVNIKLDGFFLRRPISVCDHTAGSFTLIYKTVGSGTERLSFMRAGETIDLLTGLGNGFDVEKCGARPLLIAGGGGVPPMLDLAKELNKREIRPIAVIGFNKAPEVYLENELSRFCEKIYVTTADGSYGIKGFVTDVVKTLDHTFFYTCGPKPMYKALSSVVKTEGQYSFEERMGCGFGACMGCSILTKNDAKHICKDGPVFGSEEIIWEAL